MVFAVVEIKHRSTDTSPHSEVVTAHVRTQKFQKQKDFGVAGVLCSG